MTSHSLVKLAAISLCCVLCAGRMDSAILQNPNTNSERSIELTEQLILNPPQSAKLIRVWFPVPQSNSYQTAEIVKVESGASYRITEDTLFNNRLLYFELKPPVQGQNMEISILYKIVRKEQHGLEQKESGRPVNRKVLFRVSDYLQPRGLEAVNDKIKNIAGDITRGMDDPLKKAKALYEYVLKHMQYDKTGTGWGRGDSVYACDVGKGNCTDFHSLFISLARASHIPARFQMGMLLPEDSEVQAADSYHCWAEFYVNGYGWIPVDISEAWKNPDKREYFFGNLDADRVLITTGREISLSPQQRGTPLNYLSKPYIEMDGRPLYDFKLERRFKNI